MSSVKANWHVSSLDGLADDSDPLGIRPRVESVGRPIELDNAARLDERLVVAVNREADLYNRGVTCPIKDDKQACCSACPLRHVDPLDDLTPLCEVGVEQESVVTRLRILSHERDGEAQAT